MESFDQNVAKSGSVKLMSRKTVQMRKDKRFKYIAVDIATVKGK